MTSFFFKEEAAWQIIAERLRQAAEFGRRIEATSGLSLSAAVKAFEKYAGLLG